MIPNFLKRNHKVRKLLMPPPKDYVHINNVTCPKRPDRGNQYQVSLADIEAQILYREGVMVKFLREDDDLRFSPHWVAGGHPRLGYSWSQRLPDKATLGNLHKRITRDVPDESYVVITRTGRVYSGVLLAQGLDAHVTLSYVRKSNTLPRSLRQ